MGFEYRDPPDTLSEECRTFCRVLVSMVEEAEAVGAYHQRLDTEKDTAARGVLEHALGEECRHFCMDLEFLMRQFAPLRDAGLEILFKPGKIGHDGEDDENASAPAPGSVREQSDAAGWRL